MKDNIYEKSGFIEYNIVFNYLAFVSINNDDSSLLKTKKRFIVIFYNFAIIQ